MDTAKATTAMQVIVAKERGDGCPIADAVLIEPALRRWHSYDRRFKRHKDKSLAHRAHDLEKGLLVWCEERDGFGTDPGCIRHLAESFAQALAHLSQAEEN